MRYQFPQINHINDVLPHIAGAPEFAVIAKDDYTVINYHVQTPETFPDVGFISQKMVPGAKPYFVETDKGAAIRRECRGIIFCSKTGVILRRPYHKFFNVNERAETQANTISLAEPHYKLEKLDGSMIAPFIVNDRPIWGTKMGDTEVASTTDQFIINNPHYEIFARYFIQLGYTPIFEWCSRKQRIVIDHMQDRLVVTAIRKMNEGIYLPYETLVNSCKMFNIEYVRAYDSQSDINEFINYVTKLEDTEGFVIRYNDGHMLKLKCDWYLAIHRAKERITRDREIVDMILDEQIDDVAAHLMDEDRNRLIDFEGLFFQHFNFHVYHISTMMQAVKDSGVDRKEFALKYANDLDSYKKSVCFAVFDDPEQHNVREQIIKMIKKNTVNNTKWAELRDIWFKGLKYNV